MNALAVCFALELLAAEDYRERERAQAVLTRAVRTEPGRYGPAIAAAAAQHPSAEARSRAARLTGYYRQHLASTFTPSTVPVWPTLCLLEELPWQWRAALGGTAVGDWWGRAWDEQGGTYEYDQTDDTPYQWKWRRATEVFVRDRIRHSGWAPADADRFLARLWLHELQRAADDCPGEYLEMATWSRWTNGYPPVRPP